MGGFVNKDAGQEEQKDCQRGIVLRTGKDVKRVLDAEAYLAAKPGQEEEKKKRPKQGWQRRG